jgi:hypothetical protein
MSKITEDTSVKTDIKTIGSLIAAAGFAVYMYIGMTNTINTLIKNGITVNIYLLLTLHIPRVIYSTLIIQKFRTNTSAHT